MRPPRLLASLFLCDMASNLLDFMVSGYHLLMFTADRSAAAQIVGIRINVSLRQPKRHALQYADVLTHDIELLDL